MKRSIPLLVAALSCGIAAAAGQAAISPQSLAGDWESTVSPAKVLLHLHVAADGAITGTMDVAGPPAKHIALINFHLAGSILSFTIPPLGKVNEVVMPGSKKMIGAYMWVRAGAAAPPPPPPFEPLSRLTGDWESPGGDQSVQVLRLRLDPRGALTGTIDLPEPMAVRLPLTDIQVSGRTLRYMMAQHLYEGTFSKNGTTVATSGMSAIDVTWRHVRTAAQAAASESAASSEPTNGDWSGTGNYTVSPPGLPLSHGTAKLEFHFRSNPATCAAQLVGNGTDVPCRMRRAGNAVTVKVIGYQATFIGTFSADKNRLRGRWTMGSDWHWTAPMPLELARAVAQ